MKLESINFNSFDENKIKLKFDIENDKPILKDSNNIVIENYVFENTSSQSLLIRKGEIFPKNDINAIGVVYKDVIVEQGKTTISVLTKGNIVKSFLTERINDEVEKVLKSNGVYLFNLNVGRSSNTPITYEEIREKNVTYQEIRNMGLTFDEVKEGDW